MSIAHVVSNKSLADFIADQKTDTDFIGLSAMATRCNTTPRTLRLYETWGLLKPLREGAQRLYDSEAQRRFRLIDQSRKLGFKLTEIAELLAPAGNVSELKITIGLIREQISHLEQQRARIDQTLADLRRRCYLMQDPGYDD
jgi:DNA-binding transcriptional MerR regulator